MKILLVLILFVGANVQAEVIIYKRTVKSTYMGNGFTRKQTIRGSLIVDPSTGNAAEFDIDQKDKSFLSRYKTFSVNRIDSGRGKNYLVLAEVASGTDNLGPYKYSFTAKGPSVSLDVGLSEDRSVPRRMQTIGRDVFNMGIVPFIDETSGTLVLDLAATQNANSAGRTVEDVELIMHSELIANGYTDLHP
jgi:hypothetical protein